MEMELSPTAGLWRGQQEGEGPMVAVNAYLVMTNTPSADWVASLSLTPQVLGRSREADIRVPSRCRSVSRQHASVWHDRSWTWICDCGSTYGTWINGVRLNPGRNTKIEHGDRILLGTLELVLVDELQLRRNVLLDEGETPDGADDTFKLSAGDNCLQGFGLQPLPMLTNAERDVVLWMMRGHTRPEEIGRMVHRSPNTVRTQLSSIFRKLDVHSRDELMGFLLRSAQQTAAKETA